MNLILAKNKFASRSWNMFDMPSSITPLNQFKNEGIQANALKLAYAELRIPDYMEMYEKLRFDVWARSGMNDLAIMREAGVRMGS